MWTPRERVLAVLGGEQPDRVPIFECLINDAVLAHFGGGPVAVGDTAAVIRACAGCLDLCHPALTPRAPARRTLPDGGVEVIERWNTWTLSPPPTDAQLPALLAAMIEQEEARQPDADAGASFARQAAEIDTLAGEMVYIHLGSGCPVLPFDLETGFYACREHPELARRWNRAANAWALRRLESVAGPAAGPVAIIWNDIACKNGLLYPPSVLAEYLYPHLRAQIELLHARGLRVVFHSDGNVTEALPELLACGIDGFNPLETTAGMDARAFHAQIGRRVALVGGIDAVEVLAHGTPAQVAAATRALIDLYRDDGNLLLASASGEVDNGMPLANVLAMYETAWTDGVY